MRLQQKKKNEEVKLTSYACHVTHVTPVYWFETSICGGSVNLLQDCRIYARLLNNIVRVTAQSEESIQQLSGFSF
ncbi:hypothetical protein SDJN03_20211, partial [Cucurbita argyrosperma subsp. sororia]